VRTALAVAAALTLLAAPTARAADPVRVLVDDIPLALTPDPVVQDAFLFLPLRPLAQHFQASLIVDRQAIEVRRSDGGVYLLRLGRLEVWSGGVVIAVTEAPVQVMRGTTMIPRGAVDVLFDTLTVWNPQDGVLTITTARRPVLITTTPRPAALADWSPAPATATPAFAPRWPALRAVRIRFRLRCADRSSPEAGSRRRLRSGSSSPARRSRSPSRPIR